MTFQQQSQQQLPAFFTSWAHMGQIADTQPEELINGFVPSSGVVVLAGAPGTGKSFTALSWAAAIAEGNPWFGQQTRQAPVVYVLGEGYSRFGKRTKAWETANGGHQPDNVHFVDGLTYGINLKDPDSVQQLIAMLAYVQPGLVIFDTLSVLSNLTNENDNAEVAQVMANVNKIAQGTGATAMVIHHTTKSTGSVRGASAFVGNADTVVVAAKEKNDNSTFLLSTSAQHGGKQRDGEPKIMSGFSIESPGVLTHNSGTSATSSAPKLLDPNEIIAVARVAHERQKDQENQENNEDQEN